MSNARYNLFPSKPAFHVWKSNSQTSFNTSGGAKVTWNETVYNVGGHWDGTNNRFTAPVDGVYTFKCWSNVRRYSATVIYWRFLINGTGGGYYFYDSMDNGDWRQIVGTVDLELSENDYVDLYLNSNDGASFLDYSTTNHWNGFSGHLVS